MYTKKDRKNDLYSICKKYYVKMSLLEDLIDKRISVEDFKGEILYKDIFETERILESVYEIQNKMKQNGGRLDEDPIDLVRSLRKEGKLKEAYDIILTYLKQRKNDEEAMLTFGWVMYDYLKATEKDCPKYIKNLTILNEQATFEFGMKTNENVNMLLKSLLWSMNRVAKQGEKQTNEIYEQFIRFVNNSSAFIERNVLDSNQVLSLSPSRAIIETFLENLDDKNCFSLMDKFNFNWLDEYDSVPQKISVGGENKIKPPFAEKILNKYSERLLNAKEEETSKERISKFIRFLEKVINKYPQYKWLPYRKAKLLIKVGNNEEALFQLTEFARNGNKEFWVWHLISDLVEGDDCFNCLCMGLLCKNTDEEMIVKLQEKAIPYLIDKEMYSEAKYVLDILIKTRKKTNKERLISKELWSMVDSDWYKNCGVISDLEKLRPYAEKAESILYNTLPFVDGLVTYVNENVVNFEYKDGNDIKKGFFYKDGIDSIEKDFVWKKDEQIIIQMTQDKKNSALTHVFSVKKGEKEARMKFLEEFSGAFTKVKDYGFIIGGKNEIFVSPEIVEKYKLQNYDKASGLMTRTWNKKNGEGWKVDSIDNIEKPNPFDFEKEVCGRIDIISGNFGFLEDCYVSRELIAGISRNDFVEGKARKNWNKKKKEWSWSVTEIIHVEKYREEMEYDLNGGKDEDIRLSAEKYGKIDTSGSIFEGLEEEWELEDWGPKDFDTED